MKRFSATTRKLKLLLAKVFGVRVRLQGIVYKYTLTWCGAGNQWTEIGDRVYATYWDFKDKNWGTGDLVEFDAFYEPLMGFWEPVLQAENIRKIPK